ncbi:putative ATP-dependent RNA helicase TDRD12 [Lycodopsis pacificus]
MLNISIMTVESPSCLWGRVVRGPGGDVETTDQYDRLLAHMNLFYHDVTRDLLKLKPTSLEEGQVCVVYSSVMKSWCRAVVESIIMDSVSCQVRCLLVDHGGQLVVPADQIRIAMQTFLQVPFWVRRFHLAGIKPTTLRVSVHEEKAKLIASSQWDSSATLYLHNLLQASTRTEAVLLESESDCTAVELYLTVRNVKICVNDDLVAKKFAYYSGGLDEVDQLPVMLYSSSSTSNKPTAPTSQPAPALSSSLDSAVGASLLLQRPQHEPKNSEPDAAAAESDSSEETDLSLAAALTNDLSLFRVLKCLNPGSSYQQAAPTHEALQDGGPEETTAASSSCSGQEVISGAAGVCESSRADEGTRLVESGPAEKTWSSEEDWACSRLLEWLNPEPLNPDADAADDPAAPSDPRRTGILVHSALPVEPCSSLDDAPITDALRRVMKKHYGDLSPADRYSWPSVARGCNTVIVSHNADRPLSYLAPLLTHILLNSIFTSLTSSTGPIVVLLCPGWEKVQAVYDLLEEMKVASVLRPVVLLLGTGKDEAKAVRIPKNCLLLVTTPCSLVRLLSCHCFLFLHVYHLVLDEADQLFTRAPDQMATILQHFQKVTSSEENASCPQQLVAVAKRWTGPMEGLVANHMPYPCIVMTVPEEAALYGDVQQIVLMTLESSKVSVLLGALDFNPDVGQKTLIVANSAQEVEDVFKAVSNRSAFCLKTHEGLTHQFDFVIQQWRKDIGRGTHVILVTTTECLKCLGVGDASCVVHYGFPTSPKQFGGRLSFMAENFRNLSERDQTRSLPRPTRSVLLISERNAGHVVGVLRYLRRTSAPLPPELLAFAQGVHVAREDQKTNRPLCSYLKSFGVCRASSVCPDRHRFIPKLDQSVLPASGVIEVVPLYIKTASVFYGRVVQEDGGGFCSVASEMTAFYADGKPGAEEVLEGGFYAVQEDQVFHRVKVLSVPDRGDRLFFSVLVLFIDVGKEEEVKAHQLLQLPERFHSLPGQAVEIVVCRVKPIDAEADWHPKVTRAINQKIRGLQHRARAVFSLGNTVFVDPMVRVTQVPGMKTVINEYSVQSEILNTGMGTSNQEHLDPLRALCQEHEEAARISESGEGLASLEVRIKAEVEVLAEGGRLADLPLLEPLRPVSPVPAPEQKPLLDRRAAVGQRDARTADLKIGDGGELLPKTRRAAHLNPGGVPAGDGQQDCDDSTKSFHPLARWYQTSDCVIVTVKLRNPESQRCDFYPDRVVYSCRVNGRTYRADLQLHGHVSAERCCWEMKSNEPVLKLVKQQQGCWERLVKNRNIFVSYDMEHFEEDEDRTAKGPCFVEDPGKDDRYVNCVSGSESD